MFSSDFIQQLLISIPAILLALTFHEVAHAWMADKLGDNTARMLGRLNLNPVVHLDLMGTLAFVISMLAGVGFGWAKPVPVDPRNFHHPRRGMMWVALAGPATNFILAIVSGFLFSLLRGSGLGYSFVGEPIMLMLRASFTINTALAAFNLIPILPFDGGRIVMGILPRRLAWTYSRSEPFGFFIVLGLLLLGVFHKIMMPIFVALATVEQVFVLNLLRIFGLA